MTIASLLLALCTAAPFASSDAASPPVLLDFHAEWCGPCQKMRPIVKQLKQNKYPVKSIDIDHDPDDLATRYHVQAVPTFIVVDGSGRELDRTKGTSSAVELGTVLQGRRGQGGVDARNRTTVSPRVRQSRSRATTMKRTRRDPRASRTIVANRPESDSEDRAEPVFTNPKPWESSVRIRVVGPHSTGFGSGTIIHSTPEESIILTCAHIFHIEKASGIRLRHRDSREKS